MKIPRVNDFDPNAQAPKLKSSMEDMPTIERPNSLVSNSQNTPVLPNQRDPAKDVMLSSAVPLVPPVRGVPPIKRKMKQRHPFDIYEDQLEALRTLSREDRMQGGFGSMSAMVREALDKLIAEKRENNHVHDPVRGVPRTTRTPSTPRSPSRTPVRD